MRDKIIHHYFGVDYEAVFETVKQDLPLPKQGVSAILAETSTAKKAKADLKKKRKAGGKKSA
jgi:uncharacterized protein with HEPN domain